MKRFKKVTKNLSMLLLVIMILSMMTIPVFADGQLAMLTLDSTDFTIVGNVGETHVIEAKGLSSSYVPVQIDSTKVTWESLNTKVATISQDGANVTITFIGEGEAEIKANYTESGVTSVSSNIVVEGSKEDPVNNIKVTIEDDKGNQIVNKTFNNFDVFSLKTIYNSDFNDNDVLKNNPSVLHALVKSLDNNPSKVTIMNEGSYVDGIMGIFSEYNSDIGKYLGWQYKVNGKLQQKSSSIYKLKSGDIIEWFYGPMSF